jgi:hypothetical protein
VASESTLLNCMVPGAPHDGKVKQAQPVSAATDDALVPARYMLTKKMEAQIAAIGFRASWREVGHNGRLPVYKELKSSTRAIQTRRACFSNASPSVLTDRHEQHIGQSAGA